MPSEPSPEELKSTPAVHEGKPDSEEEYDSLGRFFLIYFVPPVLIIVAMAVFF